MTKFGKTAIALAAAQIAMMAGADARAQQAAQDAPAAQPSVVVVSGQRAALQSAQRIKQDADEIVDSIVAEEAGKLPDRSVTEVLQRVVGVTIDRTMAGDPSHFFVEGSGVAIRGLSYVRSELNGRESFSANGGRSLNFEDVPPELVAGVDVYKNPSAEQTEGGISGLVNLRTALPFDYKAFKGAVSLEGSYSTLKKGRVAPSVSALLSNRWKTDLGEFGVLVDVARSVSDSRTDAMQIDPYYPRTNVVPGQTVWVPKAAMWRSTAFERERNGKYVAFQWKPNRDISTSLTWFRSSYAMNWEEQALTGQNETPYDNVVTNATWRPNGALLTGTLTNPVAGGLIFHTDSRYSDSTASTTDLSWNGEWRATPSLTLRADLQRISAASDRFDSTIGTGVKLPSQTLDLSGDIPRLPFSPADAAILADPAQTYWASTMEHIDRSRAKSHALKLDATYKFDDPVLRDLRVGVRIFERDAATRNTNPSYNWQAITAAWQLGWKVGQLAYLSDPRFASPASVHQFDNFFNGDVTVPGLVVADQSLVRAYPGSYQTLYSYHTLLCEEQRKKQGWGSCTPWRKATFGTDPVELNEQSETTRALYAQLRFGFDDWRFPVDGNLGLRYVKSHAEANGYLSFSPNLPVFPVGSVVTGVTVPQFQSVAEPRSYDNRYGNLLPTLNLRMKVDQQLQFRLAMGRAIARPSFSDMQGYTTLSEQVVSTTNTQAKTVNISQVNLRGNAVGNPMLKPVTADQIDVTAEWYPSAGSSLTYAMFYKKLKDIVVRQGSTYQLADTSGKVQNFEMSTPINGASGRARGFELAGQTYFDKLGLSLPTWLDGFGVRGSFTFVDSERHLYNHVYTPHCQGAAGTANYNLNINGCDTDSRTFGDLPLIGLSRRTINLAFMYDRGGLSARLAYNWRSRHLQAVSTTGTIGNNATDTNPASPTFGARTVSYGLPIWADDYGQLDGSLFYKFSERVALGFEAQNLNNAVYRQLMQQHIGMMGRSWYTTGPRYTVQLRYAF